MCQRLGPTCLGQLDGQLDGFGACTGHGARLVCDCGNGTIDNISDLLFLVLPMVTLLTHSDSTRLETV